MTRKKVNIKDEKFNKLTAVEEVGKTKHGSILWKFKCDCGNEATSIGSQVKKGIITSCGCARKTKNNLQSLQKNMFSDYKKRAEYKKMDFDIDFKEFSKITQQNCHYCSVEPELRTRKFTDYANGVDRIDSSMGYTTNNIVPCCKICNMAKSNLSYDDFMTWVNRLIKHTEKANG